MGFVAWVVPQANDSGGHGATRLLHGNDIHCLNYLLFNLSVVILRALSDRKAFCPPNSQWNKCPTEQQIGDAPTPLPKIKAVSAKPAKEQRQYECP
jgi:hypothetical protein